MKVAVLIKQVPDTETRVQINEDKSGIVDTSIKYIVSPYDEFAIEEAIKIGETTGAETTVISLGPERCVEAIRTALAMGIQKAIHIDSGGKSYDSYQTATILANVIKEGGFDIILCGKQAIDGDNAQVPPMIAEMIGAAQVMLVEKFEMEGDKPKITRRIGGGAKEIYHPSFPVVLGCEKGLNTPRYASLPGIMKAKSKPVDKKAAEELLGGAQALVAFSNYELPPEKHAGKMIEGEPEVQVKELVRLLREEAKVI